LDLLKAHKWIYIKLATDDSFRAALKQKNSITVEGIVMYLELVSGRGNQLLAEHYTRDPDKALAAVDKLKAADLRPNIVKSGPNYVVYIGAADFLKLADTDETVSKTIARHLAEKAKNSTPKQREIATKSYKGAIFKLALLLKPIITPSRCKKHLTPPEICVKTLKKTRMVDRPGFEPGITRAPSGHPSARLPAVLCVNVDF
jgi:hypothetical protein